MKRKIVKLISILCAITIVFSMSTITSFAASYPSVFFYSDDNYEDVIIEDTATVGDLVKIRMIWFPEYQNEAYKMCIRDSNNKTVATWEETQFTNAYKSDKHFYAQWDTKGLKSGDYTVEVTVMFYTYFSWHEAPTKEELTIHLKSASQAKKSIAKKVPVVKKIKKGNKSFEVEWKTLSGVKGYQIQYSTDKKFKKNTKKAMVKDNKITSKTIKKLKGGKKYYVRVRAYNKAKINGKTKSIYSSWSNTKAVTTKK